MNLFVDVIAQNNKTDRLPADGSLVQVYDRLVAGNHLSDDPAQRVALGRLQNISKQLGADRNENGLSGFFHRRRQAPRGLYLWGGVGGGKTLLMDLFYEHVPIAHKRRVHFHEFMDDIHQKIAIIRAKSNTKSNKVQSGGDPIGEVVKPILKEVRLLCFDEFHVNDITNAMLLGRLFEKFFAAGMVVVATSNLAPDQLYMNGLNRSLFLPFIDMLKSNCEVMELRSAMDYRRDKLTSQPVFSFGAPDGGRAAMDDIWRKLNAGQKPQKGVVEVLGRKIDVPRQALGAARFEFCDLCEKPLGARDYLAISHAFHTLMIDDIPRFSPANSNAAKRFILLVDTLYDRGVKLAASFAAPLDELGGDKDTAFEFRRTESRLMEMASDAYLSAGRKTHIQGS